MVPLDCQESSAGAGTQNWPQEHAATCELSQCRSAQVKFILLPSTEQQQGADLDPKPPLCFPGVSLLFFSCSML